MILIKEVEIYSPDYIGKKDLLVAGTKIIAIEDKIEIKDIDCEIINSNGLKLTPGFIDAHVHIAGAGGEGGPATRTPELQLSQLIEGGVTTVIGCLGTDGMTRNIESVLMKVKALREEGVSAWMYTGAYQVPTPTLMGDVGRDIALIEEIIGVGEIAISDHRSSFPSTNELIRLTEHARVGGMLGNKAGIVNIHMGDAKNPFQPIIDAVEKSELNYKQFFPTHCNRNDYIFEDAKEYGKKGWIDITTSSYPYFPQYEIKPSKALKILLESGVPLENITFTSDANGSLPDFDLKTGELLRLEMGLPKANLTEVIDAVKEENLPFEKVLKVVTENPATILKLKNKGKIEVGKDADILLFDENYDILHIIANGEFLKKDNKILKKGAYEK
ncbi:MAG: beta-aspartyl-peptidase [Bacteroidetes bacterium 4572_128]|nr:MAG: beta-aspartyl-peptidase [Bacteroidetes bacterium 4572_128]